MDDGGLNGVREMKMRWSPELFGDIGMYSGLFSDESKSGQPWSFKSNRVNNRVGAKREV